MSLIKATLTRPLFLALVLACLALGAQHSARADMIDTSQLLAGAGSQDQRADLRSLLARDDVASALRGHGVDPELAQRRVASLSDEEVQLMLDNLENLPAGGFLGTVIALIVIFMLLDIAGVTDIFPAL